MSRDPERIKPMLELLERVWSKHPDLRLGQLVVCAATLHAPNTEVFCLEDDKMEEGLLQVETL